MIKILFEDLHWRGKLLVFTWHFKKEYEKLRKPIEFILDVLKEGEVIPVKVLDVTRDGKIKLSYKAAKNDENNSSDDK